MLASYRRSIDTIPSLRALGLVGPPPLSYVLLRCASTNGGSVLVISEVPVKSWCLGKISQPKVASLPYVLVRCALSNAEMAVSIAPAKHCLVENIKQA